LSAFSELQSRLAVRFGGDDKVMALNQSMQLPGFWRRKFVTRPLLPVIQNISVFKPYSDELLRSHLLTTQYEVENDRELSPI
jgi:hypothetical protein